MKCVDEFRDPALAKTLAAAIAAEADPARAYAFMEFCGGHTHAIFRHGLRDVVPGNVRFVHGPGCPVCVLPARRLDDAIELAERHGAILCCYGDLLRVPASDRRSLLTVKAGGADVRMVYSPLDALTVARAEPGREVVFMGIGFETTTPPTAATILSAAEAGLGNFTVFCNHVLTPPAMRAILSAPPEGEGARIDGIIGPSHVSTVIGSLPYGETARAFRMPLVIAGFEPLDVLHALLMLIRQVNAGRAEVENQYTRAVLPEGNRTAQALVERVFETRAEFEWRGLGVVPDSALRIRPEFARFDAERRFDLTPKKSRENAACACPAILRGLREPTDCPLFGRVCTPETPMGACMVSSEGACAAQWTYRRHLDRKGAAA